MSRARPSLWTVQGRFNARHSPPMTGPAIPKQAASGNSLSPARNDEDHRRESVESAALEALFAQEGRPRAPRVE